MSTSAVKTTTIQRPDSFFRTVLASSGRSLVLRLTFFFLPIFLIDSGRSGWEIGLLMSLFSITPLLFILPLGLFNDRLESRKLVAAGTALLAIFYAGAVWRTDFLSQLILFFLGGLGAAMSQISLESLVLKGARAGTRGKRFGMYNLIVILTFAAASVAGGYFLEAWSFPKLFAVSAGLCLGLLALSFGLDRTRTVVSPLSLYRSELASRGKVLFAVVFFLFTFHWGAEVTSYTPFLSRELGLGMSQIGLYMGGALAALALASYFSGRYSDRLSSIRGLMAAGFVLSGTCQILMIVRHPGLSFVFRVIHEIGDGVISVLVFFWVSKIFHVDRVSGHYGAVYFILFAGQAVSTFIFGPVGRSFGYAAPLWISGLIILFCFALLTRYRNVIFEGV